MHTNIKVPQEVKLHDIFNQASIKKNSASKFVLFEYLDFKQCVLNSRRKVMHTNINIPHKVKSTRYFQLRGYKKMRQHVFQTLSQSRDSRYFIVEKILSVTTKIDLSREFVLI